MVNKGWAIWPALFLYRKVDKMPILENERMATAIVYNYLKGYEVPILEYKQGEIARIGNVLLDFIQIHVPIPNPDYLIASRAIIEEIRKRTNKSKPKAFGYYSSGNHVRIFNTTKGYVAFFLIGFDDDQAKTFPFNPRKEADKCTTKTRHGSLTSILKIVAALKERLTN